MQSETGRRAIVIAALQSLPQGATAKDLAALLGWKVTKASVVMGQLFFVNILDRRGGVGPDRRNNEYVYTTRADAPDLIRTGDGRIKPAPRLWSPSEVRIARLASEADRLADMEPV